MSEALEKVQSELWRGNVLLEPLNSDVSMETAGRPIRSTSRPAGSRPVKQTTRKPPQQLQLSLQLKREVNPETELILLESTMWDVLRSLVWSEQPVMQNLLS